MRLRCVYVNNSLRSLRKIHGPAAGRSGERARREYWPACDNLRYIGGIGTQGSTARPL